MEQLFFIIVLASGLQAAAETIKRIENPKDSWGLTYTYIGEVKNGKPNGMGIAKYAPRNVLRYAGNFANGVYSGKG